MSSKRGIVVSTPIVAKKGIFQLDAVPLDAQELRYWVLFWDKLNFPLLDGFYIDPGDDARFLEAAGILERHQITNWTIRMSGDPENDEPEEQFQHHFLKAFRELDAKEPGVWSIATGHRSITLDEAETDEGRGILFRLHHALPVPNKDVPLDEVLKFKEKRRDELLELRCNLEAAYDRIIASPDRPLKEASELTTIDLALTNLIKSAKQSGIKKWRLESVDVELELGPGVNAAVAAYFSGLSLTQSVLVGTAAITILPGVTLRNLRRKAPLPWRYVASYYDEIFRIPISHPDERT